MLLTVSDYGMVYEINSIVPPFISLVCSSSFISIPSFCQDAGKDFFCRWLNAWKISTSYFWANELSPILHVYLGHCESPSASLFQHLAPTSRENLFKIHAVSDVHWLERDICSLWIQKIMPSFRYLITTTPFHSFNHKQWCVCTKRTIPSSRHCYV